MCCTIAGLGESQDYAMPDHVAEANNGEEEDAWAATCADWRLAGWIAEL